MNPSVLQLLSDERVGVISIILSDGTIHSAAVHYSHQIDPLKVFIQTSNTTLKAQPFLSGEIQKGSFVIGFSEQVWKTLQMHGTVCMVSDPNELEQIHKIHYQKNPDAEQYKNDPTTIFLEFIPMWHRYTDFTTDPETIITGH